MLFLHAHKCFVQNCRLSPFRHHFLCEKLSHFSLFIWTYEYNANEYCQQSLQRYKNLPSSSHLNLSVNKSNNLFFFLSFSMHILQYDIFIQLIPHLLGALICKRIVLNQIKSSRTNQIRPNEICMNIYR